MSPVLSRVMLVASVLAVICITAFRPDWLSEENSFLHNFINHEYLNILGVILAITLASLSQLHLSLGRIEAKTGPGSLNAVRREIKNSAVHLIGGFIAGLLLVILKPLITHGPSGEALLNGIAIVVLIYYILILADITLSVFDIDIDVNDHDNT